MSKIIKIYNRCPAWCLYIKDRQSKAEISENEIRDRIVELREHFGENTDIVTKIDTHAECMQIDLISFGEYLKEDFEKRCKLKLLSK